MNEIMDKTRHFIVENFLFGEENGLNADTSFLDTGIIDSTGILVAFLEETYAIQIEDDELIPQILDTIVRVAAYVQKKRSGQRASVST